MGRKNVIKSYKMIDAGNLASNITSNTTNTINLDKASIHISWTGSSPVGVITVEAQNGEDDSWYELDFGSAINISGNSGDHQIVFSELSFTSIRIQYAASSGTGSVDAIISMKTVGS